MENYNLIGQKKDEEIKLFTRSHPWVLAAAGFKILIFSLLIFLILLIYKASAITAWAIFIFVPIAMIYIYYSWFNWHNSVYIITDKRIIATSQKKFFFKKVSEAPLNRIQDVTFTIGGPISAMLKFGTVEIQTAGAVSKIEFQKVPDPAKVQRKIFQYCDLKPKEKKRRFIIR